MLPSTDTLLAFAQANPAALVALAFAMGFAETMVVLAFFVPATLILVGLGALVATGAIAFVPLFLGAFAGAVAGSTTGWWLGWYFHDPVLRWGPLARRRAEIDRARRFLTRWGLWAVMLGHFMAPLRGPIFLVTGSSDLSFRRFFLATMAGSAAWAFIIPKIGQWGGDLARWLM